MSDIYFLHSQTVMEYAYQLVREYDEWQAEQNRLAKEKKQNDRVE